MSNPDDPLPRTIAFVTLCGFYAGLAQRARGGAPRPLIVGRCGEVLEASRDLAFAGIRPGMSRREAAYAAPEALWVEYEPELCLPAAEKLWQACASLTPRVEPVADHEVFLDLTGTVATPGFAALLRRALDLPDLAVCCGFASSRLVARLAAERAVAQARPLPAGERDACLAIPPGGEASFLAPLPVSSLWTVPTAVRDTLVRLGLTTAGAVFSVPEEALYRLFGPEAFRLLRHARGEDASPVPFFEAALAARPSSGTVLRQAIDFSPGAGWPDLEASLRRATQALAADLSASGRSCLRLHFSLSEPGKAPQKTTLTPQDPPG
ncbi:MAG: DNA polymerase Y family protein, partial [Chitinophagales bacterium]